MALRYKIDTSREPSPMEVKIAARLTDINIPFAQEVIFAGCKNPLTGAPLIYDFYCFDHNLLIEYDGRLFHVRDEVRARDKIKNEFARKMRIKLIRLKSRADVVIFFNEADKHFPKPEAAKKKYETKKKERDPILEPSTRFERKNKPAYGFPSKHEIKKELANLATLKAKSRDEYAARVKYIANNKKRLFAAVCAQLKEDKKAA